jgi:xanthine dehydrogenase accessory factor
VDKIELTPHICGALVTRGYLIDVNALPLLLQAPVAHVAAIGSQRRWLTAANALREMGVSDDLLELVRAPTGLELSAETPEEIAIQHHGRDHHASARPRWQADE